MKRILFLIGFLCPFFLKAQEEDTTRLLPVEVKAIRAGVTAPFAKTNIDKAQITRQNLGQDLPFLLNQTPSVVVYSDAGTGIGYTGIRIRGADPTRINVTLNGVPFNDPESQGTFFVDLPDFASSVNTIQIQRGVGTSTNGGGAFGATINLSTNEPNKNAYAEFNNSYGSFNSWKNTVKAGTGLLGNHFTADLRLSRISSDGYVDRAATRMQSFYFSTAYLADKTSVRLNIFSGKEKTYQAWYGVPEADLKTNRRINYAGTDRPGKPYENETDNFQQDHYQLFFNHQLSPKLAFNTGLFYIKGAGYYEQYKADEKYSKYSIASPVYGTQSISSSDMIRRLWLKNDFYGDIFSAIYTSGPTQMTMGGAVTKYGGDHYGDIIWAKNGLPSDKVRWYDNNAWKNDINLYGKWQQDLTPSFQLFTDVQYRRVNYDIEGFRNNPDLSVTNIYNFFNPKAGISYRYKNWLAYASYSVANKEPNRDDFETGQSRQPKPERLHDLEVGMERKSDKAGWSATIYYMRYKDQLVLTGQINDVGAYTRTNIAKSYRLGTEWQGTVVFTDWLKGAANITLSKNKIRDFTEFIDDFDNGGQKRRTYSKTDISFSPGITGAGTVTVMPVKNLGIDLISKYVGKQYLDNTGNEQRKLNPFYAQDIRAVYSFSKDWLRGADFILQVNNIFNKKYEPNGYTVNYYSGNQLTTENYYFPMAGTNWMLGVNIRL